MLIGFFMGLTKAQLIKRKDKLQSAIDQFGDAVERAITDRTATIHELKKDVVELEQLNKEFFAN